MLEISTFDPIDDCPHATEQDESFQESALFVWHDLAAGIGGFWRIGQEPVVGRLNSCFGVFTNDGLRFRSNLSSVKMESGDRGATYMGWGSALRVDLDRLAIRADFPDLQASLRFEDFSPRYDWHQMVGGPQRTEHAKAHFEVAGRMTGRVMIGGKEITIDALGYRDRSWGPRQWGTLRATRWWPAVFGPDLSVHVLGVVDEGFHGALGYVLRNKIVHPMFDIEILTSLDYDALTPRSGIARFGFGDGETGELHHTPSDGIVMHVRGYTAIESIGTVRWKDRVGFSNLEVNSNPAGGTKPPVVVFGANNADGLSRR